MPIRRLALGGAVLLLLIGLSPGLVGAPQEQTTQPPAQVTPPQPPTEAATKPADHADPGFNCGDCHELAQPFKANPHAHAAHGEQVPNSVCESCHGDGRAHAEAGGDKSLIYTPRGFEGSEKTCMSCHDRTNGQRSHRMGAHPNSATVNCLTCHGIHTNVDAVKLVRQPELELCGSCHGNYSAAFRNRPYTHRFGRAGLVCTSCHDPHARPGRENLRRTPAGENACAGCHTDKRGPFVFEHGGSAVGECWTCHEPHGSSHPNMLRRANVWQLCIECHSPLTHETVGSQPPSFHNLLMPRYQNCTTCHVAVHGSNRSPELLK